METFDKSAGDGTTPGSVEQSGNSPAVPSGCVRFTSDDFDGLIDELFDATAVLVALEARIFELEGGEGAASRWNTLRALRVLGWYAARDTIRPRIRKADA